MRRYGDNVTDEDIFDEQPGNGGKHYTRVFLGGCAATYGSFPGPANTPKTSRSQKKHLLAGLLSLFGVKEKKAQAE